MKHTSIILTLLIVITSNWSQGQKDTSRMIDSLRQVISQSPEDSNKVSLMIQLATYCSYVDSHEAIKVMDEGILLSEKLQYHRGIRACHGMKGMLLSSLGEYKQSVAELELSLQLAIEANDQLDAGRAGGVLGSIMHQQGRYPEALDYNFKALKSFELVKDSISIAASLSNIGAIYQELENYEEALNWLYKAKAIEEKLGLHEYLGNTLSNIGSCLSNLGKNEEALQQYEESYKIFVRIEDTYAQAELLVNISTILIEKKEYSKAHQNYLEALRLAKQDDAKNTIAACHFALADELYTIVTSATSEEVQEITSLDNNQTLLLALAHADSSLSFNQELDNLSGLMKSYRCKSKILEKLGRMDEALKAHQEYSAFKDSIFHIEKDKKIAQTSMQYEFDKKTAAAEAEQQKKDIREKNIRNSIIIGLLATLVFLIVVLIQRNRISKEKKRSEELLLNILPEEVAEELKSKGEADAVLIDHVTVLFTDFKGFTAISANMSPKELVKDLHDCFSAFDRIMEKHGMEKIKTIGDAYMAAGGLPTPNKTHAEDAVKAANEMIAFIEEGKRKKIAQQLPYFEIRIGIHTGPVVAGIVGVKKFQYDIWGDTVNTAARMESSGEPGKVNISETTYALVKDQFQCVARGRIAAKGKGEMEMYFVEGSKSTTNG
ncbi:MAG: tetratricopeptide repeat protein [Flavobacteriales bacterium]|nr:tetratricopeptide repeat protein [Flavobacteriales bacterium]